MIQTCLDCGSHSCRILDRRRAFSAQATPSGDGSFTVQNVGPLGWDFEIYVQGVRPPGTYVKSSRWERRTFSTRSFIRVGDSQRGGLHVDGPVDQLLEIVLGLGTGTIEGVALDAKQQIVPL
jgi:hypothetical protein